MSVIDPLPRLAAMPLLRCTLLALRNHEYRQRCEMDDNREQDERNSRLLVKKSGCDAADEPAHVDVVEVVRGKGPGLGAVFYFT